MLSTLLQLYATTILNTTIPTLEITPQVIPWNENIMINSLKIPIKNEKNIAPIIDAKSAIAVDLKTGTILYGKNIHQQLPIASLSKLMTITIILEENDLNEIVKVSPLATKVNGSKIWLVPNEKLTIKNLLYASILNSANDAATALAKYNGKTIKKFVQKMNKYSKKLKLYQTRLQFFHTIKHKNEITNANKHRISIQS